MKDFAGREIIRPVCPHCMKEMKWDPDNYYGDKLGYYCLTDGCTERGKHQTEIVDPEPPRDPGKPAENITRLEDAGCSYETLAEMNELRMDAYLTRQER